MIRAAMAGVRSGLWGLRWLQLLVRTTITARILMAVTLTITSILSLVVPGESAVQDSQRLLPHLGLDHVGWLSTTKPPLVIVGHLLKRAV